MTQHSGRLAAARRAATATVLAVLAATMTVAAAPAPARAVVPGVAQQWSDLMYRSFTVGPEGTRLRTALAAQRAAVTARAAELRAAGRADATAQEKVATTAGTDASSRVRYATALRAVQTANSTLARASAQRPRDNAAITAAKTAVIAAEKTAAARRLAVRAAATALVVARRDATATTTAVGAASTASVAAVTAVQRTEQQLAVLPSATSLRRQADGLSRDVVAQVRPVFTVADTTTVYGVTVHQKVAYSFRRMIDAAKADGIVLTGGGFRTKQRQIELRTINGCPDVWTAPASSCRVPTAIPGRSLHEIGLAVDISAGGRSLTAKSPGFAWMAAHAARYGYRNLPSEPWHWSITGG